MQKGFPSSNSLHLSVDELTLISYFYIKLFMVYLASIYNNSFLQLFLTPILSFVIILSNLIFLVLALIYSNSVSVTGLQIYGTNFLPKSVVLPLYTFLKNCLCLIFVRLNNHVIFSYYIYINIYIGTSVLLHGILYVCILLSFTL